MQGLVKVLQGSGLNIIRLSGVARDVRACCLPFDLRSVPNSSRSGDLEITSFRSPYEGNLLHYHYVLKAAQVGVRLGF